MSMVTSLNSIGQHWWEFVSFTFWQAALLYLVAWLLAYCLAAYGPSATFKVWTIAAGKLLLLSVTPIILAIPVWEQSTAHGQLLVVTTDLEQSSANNHAPNRQFTPSPVAPSSTAPTWKSICFLLWSGVVVFRLMRLIRQKFRLRRLLRQSLPSTTPLKEAVLIWKEKMRITQSVQVRMADVRMPMVTGAIRPTLIWPEQQRPDIPAIIHELAHIKRHDLMWVWIYELAQTFFFFHPVAHWIGKEGSFAREAACDRVAVEMNVSPAEMGESLLRFAQHSIDHSTSQVLAQG